MLKHAWRITWWFTLAVVLAAVIGVAVISDKVDNDPTSGWNSLTVNTWISPSVRALAALVGLVVVLTAYTTYMLSFKKGHLDNFGLHYAINVFIQVSLWVYFMYGVSFSGTIGATFALATLAILASWSILTGHGHSPIHAWATVLELGFIVFLFVWLALTRAPMLPSP